MTVVIILTVRFWEGVQEEKQSREQGTFLGSLSRRTRKVSDFFIQSKHSTSTQEFSEGCRANMAPSVALHLRARAY